MAAVGVSLLLAISLASARDFFAPNEVWISISPAIYHSLTQQKDASIPYPTGIVALDELMVQYGVKALKPMTNHSRKALADLAFLNLGLDRFYLFRFDDPKKWIWDTNKLFDLANRMIFIPGIEKSAPVRGCTLDYTPSDWLASDSAGRNMWGLDSMHCKQAWDVQRGRPTVLAVSIDTGVDYNHPDLQGAFLVNSAEDIDGSGMPDSTNTNTIDEDGNGYADDVIGYNFVNHSYTEIGGATAANGEQYSRSNRPMDVFGHGTHTFGTLSARTDNDIGVPAASFNTKTLGVKAGFAFIYQNQITATLFFDDVTLALQYAVDMGARVVSMSFGATGIDVPFQTMCAYAYAHNVACFASAGNNGDTSVRYPAAFAHVMGVSATTTGNAKADFSSYGGWVKISAPGTGIWSTMVVNDYNPDPYVAWDGTSMSTPNVAAVAALVLSRNYNLTNDQLDTLLCATATNIDAQNPSYIGMLGAGLVNAQAAVNAIGPSIITELAPRAGEVWWHTQTKTIRWIAPDSIPNVRIELNRSYPSANWETLFASTPNDSQQTWVVSGDTTSFARIRILDAAHTNIGDTTRGNIFIFRPWVQLTAPNLGDTLREGVPASITWNSGGIDSVDIDFMRTYPSGTWERLITSLGNTGTWGWLSVLGPATSTGRIRVSKTRDTSYAGMSNGNLILITPGITVLTPANNDTTHIGSALHITYGSVGTRYINIDIKRDYPNGVWENIVTHGTANGVRDWIVTTPVASNCRIRVINNQDTTMGDTTHGSFTIIPSAITVNIPNGGEVWTQNVPYNIRWRRLGFSGTNIQLNTSYPSANWTTIASNRPGSDSSYLWTVNSTATTTARIRLVNTINANQSDTSDANFTIARPSMLVTFPAVQDTMFVGLPMNFTWQSLGILGSVQIAINRSYPVGQWEVLGTTLDTNHLYRWTPTAPISDSVRMRVRSVTDTTLFSISTGNSTLTNGYIHITAPNGSETWPVGSNQYLRWTSNMGGAVKIELNRSYPGSQWQTLYPNYDNTGSFQWTVVGNPGSTNRFRVSYTGASAVFADTCDGNFTIGVLNVLDHFSGVPNEFSIYPATPNPFNPETQFQIGLPQTSRLTVEVYNVVGQHIVTLANRVFAEGYHTFRWASIDANGKGVPTGIYFVRASSSTGWIGTQKLMLMK